MSNHIETLEEQWKDLLDKIAEKGQKLREANQQQQYNEAVKDIDFWLGGLEAQLASETVAEIWQLFKIYSKSTIFLKPILLLMR